MHRLISAALALSLSVSACASRGPDSAFPEAMEGSRPGTAAIIVRNELRNNTHVDRITLSVDAHDIAGAVLPPNGRDGVQISDLPLAPGDHVLHVLVATSGQGPTGDRIISTVRSQQAFRSTGAPVVLGVVLREGAEAASGEKALAVQFAVRGGYLDSNLDEGKASAWDDTRCEGKLAVAHALCIADNAIMIANRERDALAVECLRSKVDEMHDVAATSKNAAQPHTETHRLAEERVVALLKEVQTCPRRLDEQRAGESEIRVSRKPN